MNINNNTTNGNSFFLLQTVSMTTELLFSLLLLPLSFSTFVVTALHTVKEYQKDDLISCFEGVLETAPGIIKRFIFI